MKTPIIHVTYDYSLFREVKMNRDVVRRRTLRKSIETIDLTPYSPIIVDRYYNIIDGQHRYHTLMEMGKPIYYVCIDQPFDTEKAIVALNANMKPWTMKDYLDLRSKTHKGCFMDILDFCEEFGISVSNAMVVYPTKVINSTSFKRAIPFEKWEKADAVALFLNTEEVKLLPYKGTRAFVLSIRKVFESFTEKEINKLKKKLIVVPECANFKQYLSAYNNLIK